MEGLFDELRQQFLNGLSHKSSLGLYDKWEEYENFLESDQWPDPTEKTKDFPRPCTNHLFENIEQKKQAVLASKPSILFIAREHIDDIPKARFLSGMGSFTWDNTKMDEHLEDFVEDAAHLGTGITHCYWNPKLRGGSPKRGTAWEGDIDVQVIPPQGFFPGDPISQDVQKQPYIIVAERKPLDLVEEEYNVSGLEPDPPESILNKAPEIRGVDYVTLIHRWSRVKGKIRYTLGGGGKILDNKELYKHGLYPFVVYRWYRKRRCFWGVSETQHLIDSQKEHNRLSAMTLMSAIFTALPQRRAKHPYIDTSTLTNNPQQVIMDRSPWPQWGIDYMQPPTIPAYVIERLNKIPESMREVSGMREAFVGASPSNSQLNYSAIIALQNAAGVRVNGQIRRLFSSLRDLAFLWYAYWKEFYVSDRLVRIMGPDFKHGDVSFEWFDASEYQDIMMDVVVEPGPWSPFNQTLLAETLKNLYEGGAITAEEYLELLPEQIFPYAERIMQRRQEQMLQQQQIPGLEEAYL